MRDFSLSRFLDLAMVAAVMRVSLYVCAAGAASLAARFVFTQAWKKPSGPEERAAESPAWAVCLSWLAALSPTAPVFAFVILFEIEATQAFLVAGCGPGEDCLTRVLVWPAFLFVGLGLLAACVSACRGLRRRLGGAALWPYALAPLLAGALAALWGR